MPGSTSRLGLVLPLGADASSELRVSITANANALDAAAIYTEGVIGSLPAASSVAKGTQYRTTDTGVESWLQSDGSVWLPMGLIPASVSTNSTVVNGQCLITTGSSAITITLPTNTKGALVGIVNQTSNVTTVSGSNIDGVGLSAASSFKLGTAGASAVLLGDGTNWYIVGGRQDSGWVALSTMGLNANLATGIATYTPSFTPAARLIGDRVWFSGMLHATGTISGATLWTMPTGWRPSTIAYPIAPVYISSGGTNTPVPLQIQTSGVVNGLTLSTGDGPWLEGLSYRLA